MFYSTTVISNKQPFVLELVIMLEENCSWEYIGIWLVILYHVVNISTSLVIDATVAVSSLCLSCNFSL